jgi:hypothetical protein
MEFLFPDSQRLEILLKDAAGKVVSRWSEDRTFDKQVGFTEINPSEFVVFAEHLATSPMKAGERYTVEASLADHPDIVASTAICPRP